VPKKQRFIYNKSVIFIKNNKNSLFVAVLCPKARFCTENLLARFSIRRVIVMGTISVSVPDDLKARMSRLDEVNWSAVARKAFEEKIKQIEFLEKIVAKSRMTKKDADEISKKINKKISETFMRAK